MLDKKQTKKIEKLLHNFFDKATIEVSFHIEPAKENEEVVLVKLESEEPYLLIGREGKTLQSLQGILQRILNKKLEERLIFNIDVNSYKESREKYLKGLAKEAANMVALRGCEKAFEPMNSFERRILHTALTEREDVLTESRGMGEARHVVVKPIIKGY